MKQQKVKKGLEVMNNVNYAAYVVQALFFVLLIEEGQGDYILTVGATIVNQVILSYLVHVLAGSDKVWQKRLSVVLKMLNNYLSKYFWMVIISFILNGSLTFKTFFKVSSTLMDEPRADY